MRGPATGDAMTRPPLDRRSLLRGVAAGGGLGRSDDLGFPN